MSDSFHRSLIAAIDNYTTPGDLLRRAAQLARDRAEAVRPSPWVQNGRNGVHTSIGQCIATTHSHVDDRRKAEAAHIASWHPAVALAVADWLEAVAAWASEGAGYVNGLELTNWPDMWDDVHAQALAVARAYLGESA